MSEYLKIALIIFISRGLWQIVSLRNQRLSMATL